MAETRVPSVLWNVDQSLNKTEKETARANIGAGTSNLELGETAFTAAYGNHAHGLLDREGYLSDQNWAVSNLDRLVITKNNYNGKVGYLVPSALHFDSDEKNKALTQSAEWKEFLPPAGNGSSVSVTPDGTSTGYDLGSSTTLKVFAQKFKNLVNALKALAFKDKVSTGDISDDAITASKVKDNETLPVNVSGTATKATQDSDGNNIKVTYMKATSGNKSLSYGGTTTIGTVNGSNVNLVMPAAVGDVFEVNANSTSFSDALSAYNDGKKLVLIAGRPGPSSFVTRYEIPLYRVVVNGNTITQFVWIASDDAYNAATGSNSFGSIMYYKLSSNGWDIGTKNIEFAQVAQVAVTAGSASTADSAIKAANDILGSAIEGTYVCNAKLVNGGGGTLYPGSSFTVLSDAAIKSDDATIGNRKYVELTYKSYGLGIGTRIQQVGTPYMTYNNPDTYLELSKTAYSIAGRKSQNGYFNALTSQLMGTYRNLIEVDFDYDIVATNSTASIGVAFCLASTSMAGTPQTSIATNDGRIFAFATVSGQGVGGHLRGHLHITGYLQSSHVLTGYGLCIGARSIYGDYSGTCTLKITNVNIKDSYATYT